MPSNLKQPVLLLAAAVVVVMTVGGALWSARARDAFPICPQTHVQNRPDQAACSRRDLDRAAPVSCTIITASQGDTVLFGNNEDWSNPETYYWVIPATDGRYGGIYFGFDGMHPEGGVNEKGLAFDVNALPEMRINPQPKLPAVPPKLGEHLLGENATVEEAIEYLRGYSWGSLMTGQLHIADATGAAAVMSAGADGELTFTRKQPGDGYLVSTNFNLAFPSNGKFPCWRYDTATTMLEEVSDRSVLDVGEMRSVLDAVHQEGRDVNTVYSNIIDLRQGVIYLYHWYQFDEVVVIDVAEQLSQGASTQRMRDLFPPATVERATQAYRRYTEMPERWRKVGRIYLAVTILSLVLLLWALTRMPRLRWSMRLIWVLTVLFLGVFGLLAYLLSNRRQRRGSDRQAREPGWRVALAGTAYSLVGFGVVWLVTLTYLILAVDKVTPGQVLGFTYGVPLIVGLLLFRTPLVALRRGGSYWEALRRSFLPEFISLNLACVGFVPTVSLPANTLFMSTPSATDPLLWFLLMMGVLGGSLSLFPLNIWLAYRRGAREALQAPHSGDPIGVAGDLLTFRNAWYLALLSFALYLGSIWFTMSNVT